MATILIRASGGSITTTAMAQARARVLCVDGVYRSRLCVSRLRVRPWFQLEKVSDRSAIRSSTVSLETALVPETQLGVSRVRVSVAFRLRSHQHPRDPLPLTMFAAHERKGEEIFSQIVQRTRICLLVLRALESERLAVPIGLRRQRGPDILEKGHDDILVLYRDRNVCLKDVPGVRCYGEVCGVELNLLSLSLRRGLRLLLRLRAASDGRPAGAGQVGPRGPGSGAMPRGRLLEADRPERVGRRCAVAILVE